MLDDSVSCGRSMRWFCRVAQRCACEINEDDPLLRPAHLLEAFRAQEPNLVPGLARGNAAAAGEGPRHRLLKVGENRQTVLSGNAAHALARLGQASSQEAFDEGSVVGGPATLLLDKSMVLLSAGQREIAATRTSCGSAPCRLAPALDVDDLWLALRGRPRVVHDDAAAVGAEPVLSAPLVRRWCWWWSPARHRRGEEVESVVVVV